MILKLATNESNHRQWTFYDGFTRVTSYMIKWGEVKDYDYLRLAGNYPADDNIVVLVISAYKTETEEFLFAVTSEAFLMNDDGKTIERIY